MIVTMLGVTWKIRSWKTGKVPFRPLFVYKSQAEVTAHLWLALLEELACRHGIIDPDFEWLLTLGKKPKQVIPSFLREYATRK